MSVLLSFLFRVDGSGVGGQGSVNRLRIEGLGLKAQGLGFGVQGVGCRGLGLMASRV